MKLSIQAGILFYLPFLVVAYDEDVTPDSIRAAMQDAPRTTASLRHVVGDGKMEEGCTELGKGCLIDMQCCGDSQCLGGWLDALNWECGNDPAKEGEKCSASVKCDENLDCKSQKCVAASVAVYLTNCKNKDSDRSTLIIGFKDSCVGKCGSAVMAKAGIAASAYKVLFNGKMVIWKNGTDKQRKALQYSKDIKYIECDQKMSLPPFMPFGPKGPKVDEQE